MTTCAECLTELSTMRIGDMRAGTLLSAHLETCPACASIAKEIAYAERRLSIALAETGSSYTPEELSHGALVGSERERRKEVARWVRGFLAAAACATLALFVRNVVLPAARESEGMRTETISLRCLTPEQAMEIATPYLRSTGAISAPRGMRIITVSGKHDEFERAVSRIQMIDDSQRCSLPNPAYVGPSEATPTPPTTSADKPKTD